jgi:hypothetical protein
MPKQLYKITQFHGGLNSNSDARDIAENELSDATDIMVDELGKIRLMGGSTTSGVEPPANAAVITSGYGLFYFSHDRLEAATGDGAAAAETGDDYLAIADADGAVNIDIYSSSADAWGTAKIDLGTTTGMKAIFYNVDGNVRVADANFGAANKTQWYGYIYRWFFGDGTNGYDQDTYEEGLLVNRWHTEGATPSKLTVSGFSTGLDGSVNDTTDSRPISIHLIPTTGTGGHNVGTSTDSLTTTTYSFDTGVNWLASQVTFAGTGSYVVDPGLDEFFSVGDKIGFNLSVANDTVFTISKVISGSNIVEFEESVSGTANADIVKISNLSRSEWFDSEKHSWQVGVSTLYDDGKQESSIYLGYKYNVVSFLVMAHQQDYLLIIQEFLGLIFI